MDWLTNQGSICQGSRQQGDLRHRELCSSCQRQGWCAPARVPSRKPENGIYYFVLGSSGKLMTHDFNATRDRLQGFDSDQTFMLVEITGNRLYFQAVARSGATVDSGYLDKQPTQQH